HEKRGLGNPSPVPVFIIGMPRSGTTLIEQILASHPKVFGAGELNKISEAVATLSQPDSGRPPFPETVSAMGAQQLHELGTSYVGALGAPPPISKRSTNKCPHNFCFPGLIHRALPNAPITPARRNPLDTCLSCFSVLFRGDHPYFYNLAELGRYFRAYELL